jgi:TonB family protein
MTTVLAIAALSWSVLFQPAVWTAEQPDPKCFSDVAGIMTIDPCAGWIRSAGAYDNFTVSFEVRGRTGGALGVVGVAGMNATGGTPAFALGVPLLGPVNFTPLQSPSTWIDAVPISPAALAASAGAMHRDTPWQEYVVMRDAKGLSILLNDLTIVSGATSQRLSTGWIGFRAVGGPIEIRNIRFGPRPTTMQTTGTSPSNSPADSSAPVRPGNGVTLPKVLHEAVPNYTSEAMKAKIEGRVALEVVVATDGSVKNPKVIKSLDALYGLDEEAIRCAKLWRFAPGTRDGVPVPVVVTIEMAFTLKK